MMGVVKCDKAKFSLKQDTHFVDLEGSTTKSVNLRGYLLEENYILSIDLKNFLPKILPGFVALQMGIALGLAENVVSVVFKNKSVQNAPIASGLQRYVLKKQNLENKQQDLLKDPIVNHKNTFKKVLRLKLELTKLCLKLAELAMLCKGSKGYFRHSLTHKLLLESYFVAIATPSLRHVKKLLGN